MAFWNQGGADFSNLKPALMPEEMGDVQEPDGFWESTGDAVQAGLMTTGTAAWQLATAPAIGADWVKSKATGVDSTEYQDAMFSNVVDPAVQYVDSLSHRERTMAGSLSFGIGKVLTEFAGGGAPSMAVAEFSGRASSEIRAGNSVMDANMLALNQAAWAYAGARLPGALGGSLKTKIATGAGINVVAGIGQRATEFGLMTMQGDARAADISVFGFQDMLVDAVLGAAFGPLDSVRTKGMDMPDGKAIDGAMLMDRARFEDVQVGVRAPDVMAKVDRGIAEQVRAMQEGRPALVERLPDEVTMPAWLPEVKPSQTTVVPELDEVATAIAKLGGLDRVEAEAQGIDPAYFREKRGIKSVFRKEGGASFDQMAERLDELGYPVRDADGRYSANKVLEVVDRALRGERVMSEVGADRAAQVDGWRQMQESNRAYAEQMAREDAEIAGLWDAPGKDLTDATEADIAAMFGIKPDPDMKAMQAEITTLRDSQVDLSQPIVPDVDPATVAELRAQAQAIVDGSVPAKITDDGSYVTASNEFGKVGAVVDGDSVRINFAEVEEAARGHGHGKSLYKALINDAILKGRKVYSDRVVEADAVRVYESLGRDGYVIRDNTAGLIDGGDGAVYGKQDGPAYEVTSTPKSNDFAAANDPDVAEATAFADRVKSIREVMGCLLRIGA